MAMDSFDSPFVSYLCRVRSNGSVKSAISAQRLKCGNLFFYYPRLVSPEKVLVVFDNTLASLILGNCVLFSRCEEQWYGRHDSADPCERLLGDSLFFANGYHHSKRVSLLQSRIGSPAAWTILEGSLIASLDAAATSVSVSQITRQLITHILDAFYAIRFEEREVDLLLQSVALAATAFRNHSSCPFRLRQRRSSRRTRLIIDSSRHMLRDQLDHVTSCKTFSLNGSTVSLSNLALVDEVMMVLFGVLTKLPIFLGKVLECGRSLQPHIRKCVGRELDNAIASPSAECLSKACPETFTLLANLLSASLIPFDFLKRANLCDTTLQEKPVPRSTEIWIPTWNLDHSMIFGAGDYECKGRGLSLALTARIFQWDCARHLPSFSS